MDDSKLIALLREHPVLYNPKHHQYKDANVREKVWTEVACSLKQPLEECKNRWKNIRDTFMRRKRNKKVPTGSAPAKKCRKWYLEERLQFLNHIEYEKETSTNTATLTNDCESQQTEEVEMEERPIELPTVIAKPTQEHPIDAFFNSISMSVKKLSPPNQISAKMKICQIVGHLELDEISSRSSSTLVSTNCDLHAHMPITFSSSPTSPPGNELKFATNASDHNSSRTKELRFASKYFLDDFKESDMASPDNARRALQLAKDVLRNKEETINVLKRKNIRYEKQISQLKERLCSTCRKLDTCPSGNKTETTSVDHDVSANLELELTTGEPESDPDMALVPAITMKEEPMSDPEDDAPCLGAPTSTTPSLTSVTSLAKFSDTSGSGEILGVPFGDLPTGPGSPPSMSPSFASEVGNSATNGRSELEKNRFLRSPTNESGEEAKLVSDYKRRDQFDVYGEYIASKLRRLDWRTCAHVQRAFGDIIFEAEMGKYR